MMDDPPGLASHVSGSAASGGNVNNTVVEFDDDADL